MVELFKPPPSGRQMVHLYRGTAPRVNLKNRFPSFRRLKEIFAH